MKKIFLLSYYDISDLCVYLASILKKYGIRVAVVDETTEEYIKYYLNAEEEGDIFEHQEIQYLFNYKKLDELDEVDMVLICTDKRMMLPQIEEDDEIFIFANQDRRLLLRLKVYLEALGVRGFKSVTRVLHLVESKIDTEYIDVFLRNDNISIIENIEIFIDESDMITKIENAFNLRQQFKNASKEFKLALKEICGIILRDELEDKKAQKMFKKAMKSAERGGKNAGLFSK